MTTAAGAQAPESTASEHVNINVNVKVLVTGGLGFLGSAIVRALTEQHPEWGLHVLDKLDLSPDGQAASVLSGMQIRASTLSNQEVEGSHLDLLRGCDFQYFQADITDEDEVRKVFAQVKPEAVVHTAAMVPGLSERYRRRVETAVKNVNVNGTRHVINAARHYGCKAFVYTSSCTAVTDDLAGTFPNIDESWPASRKSSIYGESKAAAEEIVLAANGTSRRERIRSVEDLDNWEYEKIGNRGSWPQSSISTCVLRPSVIFGEGDNQLIPSIHACIRKGETRYKLGDGNNMWDTVYVGNVADAHVLALENLLSHRPSMGSGGKGVDGVGCGSIENGSAAGQTFFIQNNEPLPFRDFSLAIWKEFGHFPPPFEIGIPEGLGWVLGYIAEILTRMSGQATTLCRGSVLDACAIRYASGDKARRVLGYRPRVGLEAGLTRSCQDYARRYNRCHGS